MVNQPPFDVDEPSVEAPTQPLTQANAQRFWAEFSAQEAAFSVLSSMDFVEHANELLRTYCSGVAMEVEGDTSPRGLVITANGSKEHFADVLTLHSSAPALTAFAPVTAFRQRTLEGSFSIGMDGFSLSTDEVRCQLFPDGGLVGLALRFDREIPMDMVDHARHMAFIMIDHVIGEYDFAVRVGAVDFEDAFPEEDAQICLSQLPDAFDRYWLEVLGRTGQLPVDADQGRWDMLELQPAEEGGRPGIMMLFRSADALATRADLTFRMNVCVDLDSNEDLERARDLQEVLAERVEHDGRGVFVMSLVQIDEAQRTCTFYVDSADAWPEAFARICREHGFEQARIEVQFDPSWDAYLRYWAPKEV